MKGASVLRCAMGRCGYGTLFALGFLLLSALFYNGFGELSELPKGIHQWKQSMHFSIIQSYTDGTAKLWHPAMSNLFNPDGTGRLILEFPLFHRIAAEAIDVFPLLTPVIFRWIVYLLTFVGFYHAYKLAGLIVGSGQFAFLSGLLVFALPVVAFYGGSYLVDVPAMAFGFSTIYFFEKNSRKASVLSVLLGLLFLALSGLLRLPVLILPMAYFGARVIYRRNLVPLLWTLPALLLVAAWYYYVKKYNTYFVSYPPAETYSHLSPDRLSSTTRSILNFTLYQLGWSYRFLVFYVMAFAYLALRWRSVSRFWFTVLVFALIGSAAYIYLWFGIFEHHDYYLLPVIPVLFLIWVNIFVVARHSRYEKHTLYAAIALLAINVTNTFDNMRLRTYHKSVKAASIFTGNYETGNWHYFGGEDREKWRAFRAISPYGGSKILERYGIFPADTAICDFDPSPTYSLALLNLKGWTLYNSSFSALDDYARYAKLGAKYLISHPRRVYAMDSLELQLLRRTPVLDAEGLLFYRIDHLRHYGGN